MALLHIPLNQISEQHILELIAARAPETNIIVSCRHIVSRKHFGRRPAYRYSSYARCSRRAGPVHGRLRR